MTTTPAANVPDTAVDHALRAAQVLDTARDNFPTTDREWQKFELEIARTHALVAIALTLTNAG
jgi:hypothetical protein